MQRARHAPYFGDLAQSQQSFAFSFSRVATYYMSIRMPPAPLPGMEGLVEAKIRTRPKQAAEYYPNHVTSRLREDGRLDLTLVGMYSSGQRETRIFTLATTRKAYMKTKVGTSCVIF